MPQRPIHPVNSILVAGTPIIEEYEVDSTTTNMLPGKLVKTGSAAHLIVACSDGADAIGVLDVMPDKNLAKMYATPTTYAAGDQVRVLRGDCVVRMRADHAATITVGMIVYPSDDGNVDQGAHSDLQVGRAETAPDTGAGKSDDWVIVKLTNL